VIDKATHARTAIGRLSRAARRFRVLSAGEIAMASRLFGDAIDYTRVRIYNRPTCRSACSRAIAR
jgi:hypothetical protein